MSILSKRDESYYFSVSEFKPIISYAGDGKLFKSLEDMLIRALSQERVEWRRSGGQITNGVRLSPLIVPFSSEILERSTVGRNAPLLQHPILHIYWTQCPDVETYRNTCHEEIKQWHQVCLEKGINDWLIVLVESEETRKYNKLLPRATVLDKIKNDFGVKRVDRCLSLANPMKTEFRAGQSWKTLLINIRLLMLDSLDRTLLSYGNTVRKERESRNNAQWNFCDYFLLQEELAFALEMLGIYDEALIQYDELEALFTQFIKNSSLTEAPHWISNFKAPIDGWPTISLSSNVNQKHRDNIRNHNITLLDFRCYLFCRQAALLTLTSKPWEVAQRTMPFIHNFLNEIRILELSYTTGAISSWVFVNCLEVIHMCQDVKDATQSDACTLYSAPLMELAILKLCELGELCGLMPDCSPQTSEQMHIVVGLSAGIGDPPRKNTLTNAYPVDKFKEALSSHTAYCKTYLELCEQAVIAYKHRKRIRSARYIEKILADFYTRLGNHQKSAQFLVHPLLSYDTDNWPQLSNQIRLQLLSCYRKTNEIEKLLRTSISVASNECFDFSTRLECFNDMYRLLDNDYPAWVVSFDESFSIESVNMKVDKNNLSVSIELRILNKLPCELKCSSVSMSMHKCPSNGTKEKIIGGGNREEKENDINDISRLKANKDDKLPQQLPLYRMLDYQQDKSLAGATVYCKNHDSLLRRKSSQKLIKHLLPAKQNFSDSLVSMCDSLKVGVNVVNLHSKKGEQLIGSFNLGQLCVNVNDKLLFLSMEEAFNDRKFTLTHTPPKMSLVLADGRSTIISGIRHKVHMHINFGTYIPNEDVTKLVLRASESLKIGLIDCDDTEDDDSDGGLATEIEVKIAKDEISSNNGYILPIILWPVFVWQSDATTEHKITLTYPPSVVDGGEVSLAVQTYAPFVLSRQIHTTKSRKFLQISVTGTTNETILLKNAQLSAIPDSVVTKSLNVTTVHPHFVIDNDSKVKFMWELVKNDDFPETCPLRFSVNYLLSKETANYEYSFEISNFTTLYTIECKIEPMRGNECCRVNSMCQLQFTVTRLTPILDSPIKYEIRCDQTMWAVCNMSSGVLILDDMDECSQTVDLMPLMSGFLPMPFIKLSKYFTTEPCTNLQQRISSRNERFCQGQVFNVNEATQIHILPALNVSEL